MIDPHKQIKTLVRRGSLDSTIDNPIYNGGTPSVALESGEPFYDKKHHRLYVGSHPVGLVTGSTLDDSSNLTNTLTDFEEGDIQGKCGIDGDGGMYRRGSNGSPEGVITEKVTFSADNNTLLINDKGVVEFGGNISNSIVPIGTIVPLAGYVVPNGWLMCDGSEYTQESLPELYAVIGSTYGMPLGVDNFILPRLCKCMVVGKSGTSPYDNLGNTNYINASAGTCNATVLNYAIRYGQGSPVLAYAGVVPYTDTPSVTPETTPPYTPPIVPPVSNVFDFQGLNASGAVKYDINSSERVILDFTVANPASGFAVDFTIAIGSNFSDSWNSTEYLHIIINAPDGTSDEYTQVIGVSASFPIYTPIPGTYSINVSFNSGTNARPYSITMRKQAGVGSATLTRASLRHYNWTSTPTILTLINCSTNSIIKSRVSDLVNRIIPHSSGEWAVNLLGSSTLNPTNNITTVQESYTSSALYNSSTGTIALIEIVPGSTALMDIESSNAEHLTNTQPSADPYYYIPTGRGNSYAIASYMDNTGYGGNLYSTIKGISYGTNTVIHTGQENLGNPPTSSQVSLVGVRTAGSAVVNDIPVQTEGPVNVDVLSRIGPQRGFAIGTFLYSYNGTNPMCDFEFNVDFMWNGSRRYFNYNIKERGRINHGLISIIFLKDMNNPSKGWFFPAIFSYGSSINGMPSNVNTVTHDINANFPINTIKLMSGSQFVPHIDTSTYACITLPTDQPEYGDIPSACNVSMKSTSYMEESSRYSSIWLSTID